MVSDNRQNNQLPIGFSLSGKYFYAVANNLQMQVRQRFARICLLAFVFLISIITARSQTTYYWVGGTSGSWTSGASWNTALNGSGSSRATASTTDIMIFDGTNIGGASPATGSVTPVITGSFTIGQLVLQNSAALVLQRGGSSGTSTFTIGGDNISGKSDLAIDASSSLTLTSVTSGYGLNINLGTAGTTPAATGAVYGTVKIIDGGLAQNRLVATNANSLVFESGSVCYTNTSTSGSYPFGTTTTAASLGITFQSGATLIYQGGNSIFTTTSTFNPVVFQHGSTMVFQAANATGMFNSRSYSNVIINPSVTVSVDAGFYNIDTLTIMPNATFNLLGTGVAPIAGNIVNNGTFGAASGFTTSNLLFDGTSPQSIGGTGTFNALGALSVGTNANVTLNTNLILNGTATSTITGGLNMQNYVLSGTDALQFKSPETVSSLAATVTAGSNSVTNVTNYATANISVGLLVTGAGIPANTYIIGTNSGSSSFTISQAATANGTSVNIIGNAPTCATSSSSGVNGNITTTGTKAFGTGTNYIFNAATTSPFPTSGFNPAGNVTANANITTNGNATIAGTLALNNSVFSIRPIDSLKISSGGNLSGTFGAGNYIATLVDNTLGNEGVFVYQGITGNTLLPVGSANNYLPVTLNPLATGGGDFSVNVFEGITINALPNGAASPDTAKAVNAVWSINRTNGTSGANCDVTLGWQTALQGSIFKTAANCGISTYDNTATPTWAQTLSGTGLVANKTVTATLSSFSPTAAYSVWSLPIPVGTINETACTSYDFNGTTLTASGTYYDTLQNAQGNDSIVTLNLTILQPTYATQTLTACGSYTLGGKTFTASGTYYDTLQNAAGCDSIITLNLTILQPTYSTLNETACRTYTLGNKTFTASGTYYDTLQNAAGCDSIITLNLSIMQPTYATQTLTACGSYTLGEKTFTASGTYLDTLPNAGGCDSIITINLTITHSVSLGSFTASANGNGTTLLQWTTLAETDNSGFEIQRSTNDTLTWNDLFYVNTQAPNGNSSAALSYSFEDNSPVTGYTNYYRLKETDCNGNIRYSSAAGAWFNNILLKLYPNPARGSNATVSGLWGNEEISVIDAAGRTISTQKATGTSTEINISGVSSGIYFVGVKTMNGMVYLKGMKIN